MKKTLSLILALSIALGIFCIHTYDVCAYDLDELGDLTVHFIDVGQGDSCVVELPDGRTMLIDAGTSDKGEKVVSYINENVKDKNGKAIEFLDFVIFTHSDADHIGGMSYVLSKFDAGIVYRSNEECKRCSDPALKGKEERNRFWGDKHGVKDTKAFHEAIDKAYEVADEVIVVNPEDETQNEIVSIDEKYYTVRFYSPLSSYYADLNNYSPIVIIEYRGKNIILSGDAEKKNEAEFVERANAGEGKYSIFDSFCADVIKLGHHGSSTSSSEEYLDIMASGSGRKDVLVVISCGEGNKYGHPHDEVLKRLKSMGFSSQLILRTDLNGDIVITIAEQDGIFRAVCLKGMNQEAGDLGEASPDVGRFWNSPEMQTIIRIVIAIVVLVIVLIVLRKMLKGNRKKRRR